MKDWIQYLLSNYAFLFFVMGVPIILIVDMICLATHHQTISEYAWNSASMSGRFIYGIFGILICHIFLGKSGNG